MAKKISDKVLAERLRSKDQESVVKAFELQKIYNRILRRRSSKNADAFIKTATYPHFIRLVKFAKDVNIPDIEYYLRIMATSKRNPTTWTSDRSYRIFLEKMNSSVSAYNSISISARELQKLAEKLSMTVPELVEEMDIGEMLQMVRQRRLSPWLILQSPAFKMKVAQADEGMQQTTSKIIDPTYWTVIMSQNSDAIILARKVVESLGI